MKRQIGQRWNCKGFDFVAEIIELPNKVKVLQSINYSYKIGYEFYSDQLKRGLEDEKVGDWIYLSVQDRSTE